MSLKIYSENLYNQRNFSANVNSTSEKLANDGRNLLMANRYDDAIKKFNASIQADNSNTQAHFDLARAYTYKNDYKNAIISYDNYLTQRPNDVEAITMQGECYKSLGLYKQAQKNFQTAININPKYDYALRNLKEAKNYEKFIFNPEQAYLEREKQAQQNLQMALNYAKNYFPKGYLNSLKNVNITFDKTSSLGGRANIAQYEYSKQKISITDDYVWASPEVVGAYLIHECVHAKDNDPYTSIREEQDAFETATKFWLKNSKGIEDPELDYAAELYSKSAQDLANRVEEIYKARDSQIAMTSPNHPPCSTNAATNLSKTTCSAPIRAYDVIA